MSSTTSRTGGVEPVPALLVDAGEERLVCDALTTRHGVAVVGADRRPELNLARVEIRGGPDDLTELVTDVRKGLRERFGGWCPTVDVDHTVGSIFSTPRAKVGVGRPEAVERYLPGGDLAGEPVLDPFGAPLDLQRTAGLRPARAGAGPVRPLVAVVDAPPVRHPDLAGRWVGEADLVDPDHARSSSAFGHATFVAGTIARRAPSARLLALPALDVEGKNRSTWDVAEVLLQVLDHDVAVVNMSFACFPRPVETKAEGFASPEPLALRRAVDRLAASVVLVAAAGNHAQDAQDGDDLLPPALLPAWPGAFGNVLCVGASQDADGSPAAWSPQLPWVDVVAPGHNLVGPFATGPVAVGKDEGSGRPVVEDFASGYAVWRGTSFAAAQVSGEIAHLMTTRGMTAAEAKALLLAEGEVVDGVRRVHLDPG